MSSRAALVALAATLLVGTDACGGQSPSGGHPASHSPGQAAKTDPQQAFLQAMVPHHRSAIETANVADREAESPFIGRLATAITKTQQSEIAEMRRIHERLFRSPLRPDDGAHEALGLSTEEAVMNHMPGGMMLHGKRPFDRAFVDEMVPHHRGAIAMAEAVLEKADDPALRKLAEGIITAQRREIAAMEAFAKREYDEPRSMSGGPAPHHVENHE